MIVGVAGSHRTGKSTLARAFAKKHGFEFLETSASQVFKDHGLDPSKRYDMSVRLMIQREILKTFEVQYRSTKGTAITDRTPLDMLAYTMSEALQETVSPSLQPVFDAYVADCIQVMNKYFGMVVVIQPGIPIVEAEGKAANNKAYMEHINSLVLGLTVDERIKAMHFYLPRHLLDMDDRIAALEYAVERAKQRSQIEQGDSLVH